MYSPGQVSTGGGQMQIMNALGGGFMVDRPRRNELLPGMTINDIRADPSVLAQFAGGDPRQQRMNALRGTPGMPLQPVPQANPGGQVLPPQANVPQSNPVFGQPIPANMVGGSYGITGLKPAQSGFDLPTY